MDQDVLEQHLDSLAEASACVTREGGNRCVKILVVQFELYLGRLIFGLPALFPNESEPYHGVGHRVDRSARMLAL